MVKENKEPSQDGPRKFEVYASPITFRAGNVVE
jgi:hypothetical protein